jgi:D-tagatose-1,6-bisphosphate aldolase subunit GatZ/KbaZ
MQPAALAGMSEKLLHLRADHLAGRRGGIVSVCSARREVIEAALDLAAASRCEILVEATANQVNPAGGYTGMTPEDFVSRLGSLAESLGFPREDFAVGADHLGPYVWRAEPAVQALAKAVELAGRCVSAGFQKLHLDTGCGCADDPPGGISLETAAARAAQVCRAAEAAADRLPAGLPRPLYVIGAETPPPGGSLEAAGTVEATPAGVVVEVVRRTESAFRAAGLDAAWGRVIGVVVQPGVDFGDTAAAAYLPGRARGLSEVHAALPGAMTFEVHSTDFQPAACLAGLVRDHFILLKVGPCLTFAFREAVFALAEIETEWLSGRRSHQPSLLRPILERVMKQNPVHWKSQYRGPRLWRRYLRSYSCRDRIRYYWAHPDVAAALQRLLANLGESIPIGLIHQFFPDLADSIANGELPPQPQPLIRRRIQNALRPYVEACR